VIYIIVSNVKKNVAILNSLSAIFNEFEMVFRGMVIAIRRFVIVTAMSKNFAEY